MCMRAQQQQQQQQQTSPPSPHLSDLDDEVAQMEQEEGEHVFSELRCYSYAYSMRILKSQCVTSCAFCRHCRQGRGIYLLQLARAYMYAYIHL